MGFAGCFHAGLHARPGEVLPAGHTALEADGTPLTVAPAGLGVGTEHVDASFGARQMLHPIFALFIPPYAVGGGLRVGLGRGLELDAALGAQEATAGLRVALAPHAALSVSGGVYPSWFPLAPNPRGTVTVDASRGRFVASLGANVGQQVYVGFLPARLARGCGGFGDPGCGEYSPGPSLNVSRAEVRAVALFGYTGPSDGDDGPSGITIAVAPWVTAATLGAPTYGSVRATGRLHDFHATAGASVLVGLSWGPFDPPTRPWWIEEDRAKGPPGGEGPWTEALDDGGTDVGTWHRGRREGAFEARRADGSVSWTRSYHRGRLHGPSREVSASGQVLEQGRYRRGHHVGWWEGWYESGAPRFAGRYTAAQTGAWTSWAEDGTVTFTRP